jgi:hypothetical protein
MMEKHKPMACNAEVGSRTVRKSGIIDLAKKKGFLVERAMQMLTVIQNDDEAPGLVPLLFHGEQIRKFNGKQAWRPQQKVQVCPERLLGRSGTEGVSPNRPGHVGYLLYPSLIVARSSNPSRRR